MDEGQDSLRRHGSFVDATFEPPQGAADDFTSLFGTAGENSSSASPVADADVRCAPGVGLAGCLWSAASSGNQALTWHHLQLMSSDPELPADPRTVAAAACFGAATGVLFDVSRTRGIVVLFTRSTADLKRLQSAPNEIYLNTCANLCGSVASATRAGRALDVHREGGETTKRLRMLRALTKTGLLSAKSANSQPERSHWLTRCGMAGRSYLSKFGGAGAPALAPASWDHAIFSFVGAALTHVLIGALDDAIAFITNDPHSHIQLGALGALMTMHFAAFNSPLAQPRNVIGGNAIAAVTSFCFVRSGLLDATSPLALPVSIGRALLPATAIGLMQLLGLTHPPAGGIALLVASSPEACTWQWILTPLVRCGDRTRASSICQPGHWHLRAVRSDSTSQLCSLPLDPMLPPFVSTHSCSLRGIFCVSCLLQRSIISLPGASIPSSGDQQTCASRAPRRPRLASVGRLRPAPPSLRVHPC